MKLFLSFLLMTSSFTAFAQDDFAKMKAEMVSHMDKKIAALQEAKECLNNATQKEDLKKCHKAHKEDRKEMMKEKFHKRDGLKNKGPKKEDSGADLDAP